MSWTKKRWDSGETHLMSSIFREGGMLLDNNRKEGSVVQYYRYITVKSDVRIRLAERGCREFLKRKLIKRNSIDFTFCRRFVSVKPPRECDAKFKQVDLEALVWVKCSSLVEFKTKVVSKGKSLHKMPESAGERGKRKINAYFSEKKSS